MDFDAFDDELLNLSPLQDTDLWPNSPPAAIETQPTDAQQSDNSNDESSEDDDGLYGDASPGEPRDDCSEGSFGDEEQVIVAADQYSWKIDHSKGDHKFKGALVCWCVGALVYCGLYAHGSAYSD